MMQLSSKMMTHHFVMTSSLLIKILKIDKYGDFSCDIDYDSRTDVFRDVIYLIINQCNLRRPQGASGGHKVSASRTAQARKARACGIKKYKSYSMLRLIGPPDKGTSRLIGSF